MSLRRLRVLVSHLPPDSATARALRGHHWGDIEFLLAHLADTVAAHRWEWLRSHGANAPQPQPVRRPGTDPDEQRRRVRDAHDLVMRQLKGAESG